MILPNGRCEKVLEVMWELSVVNHLPTCIAEFRGYSSIDDPLLESRSFCAVDAFRDPDIAIPQYQSTVFPKQDYDVETPL